MFNYVYILITFTLIKLPSDKLYNQLPIAKRDLYYFIRASYNIISRAERWTFTTVKVSSIRNWMQTLKNIPAEHIKGNLNIV